MNKSFIDRVECALDSSSVDEYCINRDMNLLLPWYLKWFDVVEFYLRHKSLCMIIDRHNDLLVCWSGLIPGVICELIGLLCGVLYTSISFIMIVTLVVYLIHSIFMIILCLRIMHMKNLHFKCLNVLNKNKE